MANWDDVTIVNNKELYDFNDKLIAHDLDIKNNKTGSKAYVILSENVEDNPILVFSKNSYSPYSNSNSSKDDKYILSAPFGHFIKHTTKLGSKVTDQYYDLETKNQLNDNEVIAHISFDKTKNYKSTSPANVPKQRNALLVNTIQNSVIKPLYSIEKRVNGTVPNYDWLRGCGPTSAAMLLEYRWYYQTPSPTTLINKIADTAGTLSNGYTPPGILCQSIVSSMYSYGVNCTSYQESNYSSISLYETEIDNNRPVIAMLLGCQYTFADSHQEMGYHYVCALGYMINDQGDFIICHDTSISDGDMYLNTLSSLFGWSHAWLYVR